MLFLSSSEYGDTTSGPGVVVTNTLRCLASMKDVDSALGVFRPSDLFKAKASDDTSHYLPAVNTLFHLKGRPYSKFEMLRGMAKISRKDETEFLREVSKASKSYDIAVWFGAGYDPVSLVLPDYCNCPLLFHINDSLLLYQERQIRKRLKNLRIWAAERHERRILASEYARVIYVSQEDYDIGVRLSMSQYPAKAVCLPIGVDINVFRPRSAFKRNSGKIVLFFSGTMFYQPNVDAALYLIKEIMPKIRHDVELRIAGRDPTPAIIEAAKADERIAVVGAVPDMAAEYRIADIVVAPMISAAGIKIKILEAMSCGLPVITTPRCVRAFPEAPDGVLTGETADEIVRIIERLINDEAERTLLGCKSRMFIERSWSWEQRTGKLVKICNDVLDCKERMNS